MAADRAVWPDRRRDDAAAWRLHYPRIPRRADVSESAAAAGRTASVLVLRRRRGRGAVLAQLCGGLGPLQRRGLRVALRASAPAVVSALQPARADRRP